MDTHTDKDMDKVYSRHTIYGPPDLLSKRLKKFRSMSANEYEKYCSKIKETGGFNVDGCSGSLPGRIVPIVPGSIDWEPAEWAAKFVVEEVKIIEYRQLVEATIQPVCGHIYYLTFTAIDVKHNVEKLYKAKVHARPANGLTLELVFFREVPDNHFHADEMRARITAILAKIESSRESSSGYTSDESLPKEIKISRKELHSRGFWILVKDIRSQNPTWKYSRVRKTASKKWKSFKVADKIPYLSQAQEIWNDSN